MGKKLFDFCIGNPPYQGENDKNGRQPPVYHEFMDAAYKISTIVELITPARFLFDAGQTPKAWNEKMLKDSHLKILHYEKDATIVFPNTDIKGGIVVTYRNSDKVYDSIGIFTPYEQLNNILKKILQNVDSFLDSIISSRGCYRFSEKFFQDNPKEKVRLDSGTGNMIVSNIFDNSPEVFCDNKKDDVNYIKLTGRAHNQRVERYILRNWVQENNFLDCFNVLLTEANNSGAFGETLTPSLIAGPREGATDTFISIGTFKTESEAINAAKYLKTKIARALLGVKKATQHNPKSVWKYVPLQDFTSSSDIDWSKSIHEIDLQLYKKYGLNQEEIDFIEKNVKEMA